MSEIRVDTISEKTSANGVAVDGVTIKDGTVKSSISNSTQTTAGLTIDNTVSGGYGAALAFDVHRSDSGNQATAARIYPARADVWSSDGASDSDLNFQVSQDGTVATRMTVSGTGDVSVTDGNLLFQGAGHGVYLGVTSATAANLLDDYEEGTWTPSGSSLGVATNHKAIYRKIGDIVFLYCDITMDSSPSDTAQATSLAGFPFTCNDDYFQCNSRVAGLNQVIEANIAGTGAVFRDKSDGVICTRSEFAGDRCQHIFIYTTA